MHTFVGSEYVVIMVCQGSAHSTLLNMTSKILAYITDTLIIYFNRTHRLSNEHISLSHRLG